MTSTIRYYTITSNVILLQSAAIITPTAIFDDSGNTITAAAFATAIAAGAWINGPLGTGIVAKISNAGVITTAAAWNGSGGNNAVFTVQAIPRGAESSQSMNNAIALFNAETSAAEAGLRVLDTAGAAASLTKLDALVGCYILSMKLTTPPSSPSNGDAYFIAASATDDWSGYDGYLAYFVDSTWKFYKPFLGLCVFCNEDGLRYIFINNAFVDYTSLISLAGSVLASGKILVGNASGAAAAVSLSGDATVDNAGAVTVKQIGGHAVSVSVGGTLMTLENAETISGVKTFSAVPVMSGGGIKYPATQIASTDANTLDDYEEGTWTPVLTAATAPVGVTYQIQYGRYVKIGSVVHLFFGIKVSSVGSGGAGVIRISGLPFAQVGTGSYSEAAVLLGAQGGFTTAANAGHVGIFISTGAAFIEFRLMNTNGDTELPWSEITTSTFIGREIVYIASA